MKKNSFSDVGLDHAALEKQLEVITSVAATVSYVDSFLTEHVVSLLGNPHMDRLLWAVCVFVNEVVEGIVEDETEPIYFYVFDGEVHLGWTAFSEPLSGCISKLGALMLIHLISDVDKEVYLGV